MMDVLADIRLHECDFFLSVIGIVLSHCQSSVTVIITLFKMMCLYLSVFSIVLYIFRALLQLLSHCYDTYLQLCCGICGMTWCYSFVLLLVVVFESQSHICLF